MNQSLVTLEQSYRQCSLDSLIYLAKKEYGIKEQIESKDEIIQELLSIEYRNMYR